MHEPFAATVSRLLRESDASTKMPIYDPKTGQHLTYGEMADRLDAGDPAALAFLDLVVSSAIRSARLLSRPRE